MNKFLFEMETAERFIICGCSGSPYEFNFLMFEDGVDEWRSRFKEYPGIFIFCKHDVHEDIGKVTHRLCCICSTSDIERALLDEGMDIGVLSKRANCICYYYEPSEEVRMMVFRDIAGVDDYMDERR